MCSPPATECQRVAALCIGTLQVFPLRAFNGRPLVVMHYEMHYAMHYVMHYVMHYAMHSAMHHVMQDFRLRALNGLLEKKLQAKGRGDTTGGDNGQDS